MSPLLGIAMIGVGCKAAHSTPARATAGSYARLAGHIIGPSQRIDRLRDLVSDPSSSEGLRQAALWRMCSALTEHADRLEYDGHPAEARGARERAVLVTEYLLEQFPEHPHADGALYLLGRTWLTLAVPLEAAAAFDRLVHVHPKSSHAADAWAHIADIAWLVHGDTAVALHAYPRGLVGQPAGRAAGLQHRYGEVLVAIDDPATAYHVFMAGVRKYPHSPQAGSSAWAAMHAAFQADDPPLHPPHRTTRRSLRKPRQMRPWLDRAMLAAHLYLRVAPAGPHADEAIFKRGLIYFDHQQFERATQHFEILIARDPASHMARVGVSRILDGHAVRDEWGLLVRVAQRFAAHSVAESRLVRENIEATLDLAQRRLATY